jgi:hypothetical protein
MNFKTTALLIALTTVSVPLTSHALQEAVMDGGGGGGGGGGGYQVPIIDPGYDGGGSGGGPVPYVPPDVIDPTPIVTFTPGGPIEDQPYQPSTQLEYDDYPATTQTVIQQNYPMLLDESNELITANTIHATVVEPVVDPRFGQIDPAPRALDAAGNLVAAPVGAIFNPAPVDILSGVNAISIPVAIAIPTTASAAAGGSPSLVAPSVANGGISRGSHLAMAMSSSANPFTDIPVMTNTTRSTQDTLTLNVQATCFPTNLRAVANPVSPNAIIRMKGKYSVVGSQTITNQDFFVEFPARAVMMGAGSAPVTMTTSSTDTYKVGFNAFNPSNGVWGNVINNLVSVTLPSITNTSVDTNTGTITSAQNVFQVSDVSFEQTVPAPTAAQLVEMTSFATYQAAAATYLANHGAVYWIGYQDWKQSVINQAYMGVSGPIGTMSATSAGLNISQSSDGKTISISASLPGDLTMCGGYYSPLMVFFDKDRPNFENVTDFKMKHDQKTYWPNKNHAGYFVGLLNKNGKIESHQDLFGEGENIANGFISLGKHDKNKDGKIDAKDPIFKKLVLWKDSEGKGQFNKKDMVYLSKKIQSIDLKYNNNFEMAGIGAEYRQRSSFTFKRNGKVQNGEIIDVWFKPYTGNDRQMASHKEK